MQRLILAGGGLVGLGLAASFMALGSWWAAGLALVLGGLWLAWPWHQQPGALDLALLGWVGLAVYAILLKLPALGILTLLVAALAVWDLARLQRRLATVEDVRDRQALQSNHIRRLAAFLGLGWLVGALALTLTFSINLVVAILLGAALVWGLSQVVRYLLRENRTN